MACNCVVGFTDSMPKVLDGEKCRCSSDLLSYDFKAIQSSSDCSAAVASEGVLGTHGAQEPQCTDRT